MLVFIINDVAFPSYVDGNTRFFVGKDADHITSKLRNSSKATFQWFNDNQMKANPDTCHFICSTYVKINIMVKKIRKSACEKLLVVFLTIN